MPSKRLRVGSTPQWKRNNRPPCFQRKGAYDPHDNILDPDFDTDNKEYIAEIQERINIRGKL